MTERMKSSAAGAYPPGAAIWSIAETRPRLWLAAIGLLLFLPGLNALPPLDRDEARFAQATAQMLESGDFIRIKFQEDDRNKKPAGIHWLQAASVAALSSAPAREIWAYRIPSVLAAILALLFTFEAGRALFDRRIAVIGASLLGATLGLMGEATIAKTDAALLASVCGGMAALARIYAARRAGSRAGLKTALAFWAAVGVSILIKGPVGPMIFALTIPALRFAPPAPAFLRDLRPLAGAGLALLIAAPWLIAIGVATQGAFYVEALGGDAAAKIFAGQESHGAPPGYYLALVWIGFWPASFFLAGGLVRAVADRVEPGPLFCLAWAGPAWIVFELTATKLPHYTLPLFPALALLAAHAAARGATGGRWPAILRRAGAALALLGGLAFAGLLVYGSIAYGGQAAIGASLLAAGLILAASLAIFVLIWRGAASGMARAAALTLGLAIAASYLALERIIPRWSDLKVSTEIAALVKAADLHPLAGSGAPPVALIGYYEPSAVFLLGTQTALLTAETLPDALSARTGGGAFAAAVDARLLRDFQRAAAEAGFRFESIGAVAGLNYSNGDEVELRLYRVSTEQRGSR